MSLYTRAERAIRANTPRGWHLFNAEGQTVGRLATNIARLLMGKHRPTYDNRRDEGDFVVVRNAEKVVLTGRKWDYKMYRRHSGYPGGLKEMAAKDMLERHPTRVLEKAVYGMLPKNKHRKIRLDRLKLFLGPEHEFEEKFERASSFTVDRSSDLQLRILAEARKDPKKKLPDDTKKYL